MSDVDTIQTERGKTYGPWRQNMTGTSQQIAGLLTQMYACGQIQVDADGIFTIPDWTAPMILALAVKGNRIASGHFLPDNYDDAEVYLRFVKEMQQ